MVLQAERTENKQYSAGSQDSGSNLPFWPHPSISNTQVTLDHSLTGCSVHPVHPQGSAQAGPSAPPVCVFWTLTHPSKPITKGSSSLKPSLIFPIGTFSLLLFRSTALWKLPQVYVHSALHHSSLWACLRSNCTFWGQRGVSLTSVSAVTHGTCTAGHSMNIYWTVIYYSRAI